MIRRGALFLLAALGVGLASAAGAAESAPPGASSCSGCHAPPGKASEIPPIAGRSAAELVTALDAFRSGARPATVMGRIVKGFSPEETKAIVAWLAAQK